ncbi:hypothetical protein LIER_43726 [Lithospermum erythrorhizon]|uniref:Transposase n=1 Tax=Lithospermum erythrorhizon TaxID=34254 RepID=A0AAV3QNJ6_LITER
MKKLRDLSQSAHQWLIDHADPFKQWVRAFFPHDVVSDTLCNNYSEPFNAFLLEARDKPLITMLELIRSKVMEKIKDRFVAMSKKYGPICVKIKIILVKNVNDCVGYTHRWNGRDGFEVRAGHEQYIVNTRLFTCSCAT